MTEIKFDSKSLKVTIKGHAMSDEAGKDLVCAAVSALTYTLAENIEAYSSLVDEIKAQIRLDNGDAEISVAEYPEDIGSILRTTFTAICVGFDKLARTYPENVKYTLA